jgi:hypothetical protein
VAPRAATTIQTFEMSDSNREAIERHQDLEKVYELKKKADKFPIPTNDDTVKSMLR